MEAKAIVTLAVRLRRFMPIGFTLLTLSAVLVTAGIMYRQGFEDGRAVPATVWVFTYLCDPDLKDPDNELQVVNIPHKTYPEQVTVWFAIGPGGGCSLAAQTEIQVSQP